MVGRFPQISITIFRFAEVVIEALIESMEDQKESIARKGTSGLKRTRIGIKVLEHAEPVESFVVPQGTKLRRRRLPLRTRGPQGTPVEIRRWVSTMPDNVNSDELIVDLTGYRDRIGSRVEPGRYDVVVEDAETDSSKAGNPMANLWLRIEGGDFDGATIIDRLTLTDKSMFRVVGFMQAIGLPTPRKRFRINVRSFIGKRLQIDVEDGEPYNGRIKSEVRGYMRKAGGQSSAEPRDLEDINETAPDDLSGLDEFAEKTEDSPLPVGDNAPAAPPRASKPAPEIEDDVLDLDEIEL